MMLLQEVLRLTGLMVRMGTMPSTAQRVTTHLKEVLAMTPSTVVQVKIGLFSLLVTTELTLIPPNGKTLVRGVID